MFVFFGAILGLLIGGVPGLVIGGLAGLVAGPVIKTAVLGRLQGAQSRFIDPTVEVMGALCKADGIVTQDEIQVIEQIFDTLHLSPENRQQAKAAFRRGKESDFDLDAAVDQYARVSRGHPAFLQLFLHLQAMAIAADGVIHEAEHAMLLRVALRLGLDERDLDQFEALLQAGGPRRSTGGDSSYQSPSHRLNAAYLAIGVSPSAEDAEVKRAYRRLISENHPDKLAGRGLPESMRAVAEERSREINKAYDLIKDARGMK